MTDTVFYKAVTEFGEIAGGSVGLTPRVGDALIDPNFLRRVRYLREQPFIDRIFLTTNGILLDWRKLDSAAATVASEDTTSAASSDDELGAAAADPIPADKPPSPPPSYNTATASTQPEVDVKKIVREMKKVGKTGGEKVMSQFKPGMDIREDVAKARTLQPSSNFVGSGKYTNGKGTYSPADLSALIRKAGGTEEEGGFKIGENEGEDNSRFLDTDELIFSFFVNDKA